MKNTVDKFYPNKLDTSVINKVNDIFELKLVLQKILKDEKKIKPKIKGN